MNIQDKITDLFIHKYGWTNEEILYSDSFEGLGLDSLTIYSLVTECEEEFKVQLDIDDIWEINSPMKFITYVEEKCQNET